MKERPTPVDTRTPTSNEIPALRFPPLAYPHAIALWVASTYESDWSALMYVAIVSPQKQSGETRLLEGLELLVKNPVADDDAVGRRALLDARRGALDAPA